MFMKSGKCYPLPFSLQLYCPVFYLLECVMHSKVSHSNKQPDMFQLLIRAKQYRDDDSRLISPFELIAVEHPAVWRKWTTCWMTSQTSPLQQEKQNHELRTRHATIIKSLSEFLQFHGHDSCIKFEVTVYTHRHQCHFFPALHYN